VVPVPSGARTRLYSRDSERIMLRCLSKAKKRPMKTRPSSMLTRTTRPSMSSRTWAMAGVVWAEFPHSRAFHTRSGRSSLTPHRTQQSYMFRRCICPHAPHMMPSPPPPPSSTTTTSAGVLLLAWVAPPHMCSSCPSCCWRWWWPSLSQQPAWAMGVCNYS